MQFETIKKIIRRYKNELKAKINPDCDPDIDSYQDCILDTTFADFAESLWDVRDDKRKFIGLLSIMYSHTHNKMDETMYSNVADEDLVTKAAEFFQEYYKEKKYRNTYLYF